MDTNPTNMQESLENYQLIEIGYAVIRSAISSSHTQGFYCKQPPGQMMSKETISGHAILLAAFL